jgi:hypothetical protein
MTIGASRLIVKGTEEEEEEEQRCNGALELKDSLCFLSLSLFLSLSSISSFLTLPCVSLPL